MSRLLHSDGSPRTPHADDEPDLSDVLGDLRVPVHRFFE